MREIVQNYLFSIYLIGNMCVPGTANEEMKDC